MPFHAHAPLQQLRIMSEEICDDKCKGAKEDSEGRPGLPVIQRPGRHKEYQGEENSESSETDHNRSAKCCDLCGAERTREILLISAGSR
jgi:hypothetical protein